MHTEIIIKYYINFWNAYWNEDEKCFLFFFLLKITRINKHQKKQIKCQVIVIIIKSAVFINMYNNNYNFCCAYLIVEINRSNYARMRIHYICVVESRQFTLIRAIFICYESIIALCFSCLLVKSACIKLSVFAQKRVRIMKINILNHNSFRETIFVRRGWLSGRYIPIWLNRSHKIIGEWIHFFNL